MELYTNEDEQVERVKKWLKEYGPTVAISLIIVIIGFFGWRYWKTKELTEQANASNYYEQLVSSSLAHKTNAVEAQSKTIMKKYTDTPYAALAGLLLAKQYVDMGKMSEARTQLQWVIDNASVKNLQQVARNRLAKLLIAEKKPQEALKLLKTVNDKAYLAAIEMIKGDAFVALNKNAEAKKSYNEALKILPKNSDSRPLLEMKLADLPSTSNS